MSCNYEIKDEVSELNPSCPVCGIKITLSIPGDYYWHSINKCLLLNHIVHHCDIEKWNHRPVEDALKMEIDDNTLKFSSNLIDLEARIAELSKLLVMAKNYTTGKLRCEIKAALNLPAPPKEVAP